MKDSAQEVTWEQMKEWLYARYSPIKIDEGNKSSEVPDCGNFILELPVQEEEVIQECKERDESSGDISTKNSSIWSLHFPFFRFRTGGCGGDGGGDDDGKLGRNKEEEKKMKKKKVDLEIWKRKQRKRKKKKAGGGRRKRKRRGRRLVEEEKRGRRLEEEEERGRRLVEEEERGRRLVEEEERGRRRRLIRKMEEEEEGWRRKKKILGLGWRLRGLNIYVI
ncbi:hypothetical protein LINPERPRIM_LOCUS5624 [Linum perenne]